MGVTVFRVRRAAVWMVLLGGSVARAATGDCDPCDGVGSGLGRFAVPLDVETVSSYIDVLAVGDLDGDGDGDVVAGTGAEGAGTLAWYENRGADFAPGVLIPDDVDGVFRVALGDVDGDGDLDVVSVEGTACIPGQYYPDCQPESLDEGVFWYENLGGVFGARRDVAPGVAPASLHLLDLDGDGDTDVLAGATWYPNQGGGTFAESRSLVEGVGEEALVVDLDSDGDVDLLQQDKGPLPTDVSDESIVLFAGQGDGTFAPGVSIAPIESVAGTLAVGDSDGDGDLDVFQALTNLDRIDLFENLGAGVFGAAQRVVEGLVMPQVIEAFDADGDGDDDLAVGWYHVGLRVHESLGDGTFAPDRELDGGSRVEVVAPFDVDADGDVDLVTSWISEQPVRLHDNVGTCEGLDSDQDGLIDADELCVHGTDPFLADTDGDGFTDDVELDAGTDPTDRNDTPAEEPPDDTEAPDTGAPAETDGEPDAGDPEPGKASGCGCATAPTGSAWAAALAGLAVWSRRRSRAA